MKTTILLILICLGLNTQEQNIFAQSKKSVNFLSSTSSSQGNWVFLGQRAVSDRLDHDIINVSAKKGHFKALHLKVKGASVDFHKVVVVFANGSKQEIKLRNTIPSGGQTRAIDLNGKGRFIKEIRFWYDANIFRKRKNKRKTVVSVWGKK